MQSPLDETVYRTSVSIHEHIWLKLQTATDTVVLNYGARCTGLAYVEQAGKGCVTDIVIIVGFLGIWLWDEANVLVRSILLTRLGRMQW